MRKNSGQVTLLVLLVMVVLLTVGLAVVSRSVTDIRISKETEESARAFSAAEAGIEEALKHDLATLIWTDESISVGDLEAKVTVTETNSFETKIEQGETAEVNLKDYSGNIEVSWRGKVLELTLIYQDGDYKIIRDVYNLTAENCDDIDADNFTNTFTVPASLPADSEKALRVRPICAEATVTVSGVGNPLPEQSYKIRSEVVGPGKQVRTVEVTKSLPILPPIFDYVLFSGGTLVK